MPLPECDNSPIPAPAEPFRAAPGTLQGMIQRGHGAARANASANPRPAAGHVIDCVIHDPRWDHQIESRSWLYATLVTDLGIALPALRAAYATPADPSGDSDAWLLVGVLECLAQRGIPGAVSELRRYLATGRDPELALNSLIPFADYPEAEGLPGDLLDVADDETLTSILLSSWQFPDLSAHPWSSWRRADPRMDRAAEAAERARAQHRRELPPRATRQAMMRDRAVRFAIDAGYLTTAAAESVTEDLWTRLLLDFASVRLADTDLPPDVRHWLRRQFRNLRTPDALAWARATVFTDRDHNIVALDTLAALGEEFDAPLLLEHLKAAATEGDSGIGDLCDVVPALGRLRFAAARTPIEEVFDSTPYSYLRERCAGALSALAPDFPRLRAVECLDDCESGTREIGIAHADLSNPAVRERVTNIAADASEEPETRRAATARLARHNV